MPHSKDDFKRGAPLIGSPHRAYDRRDGPQRGSFMVSSPPGVYVAKRAPLPADLETFQNAADFADQLALAAPSLDEIEARLSALRKKIHAMPKR